MTKTTLILSLLIILSCKNTSTKTNKEIKNKVQVSTGNSIRETKIFQKEKNLFLSFYKGMTKKEFRDNGISQVKTKKIFTTIKNYDYKINYKLIDKFDFNDKLIDSIDFFMSSNNFYYPFRIPNHNYFTLITPEYDDNTLISVTLSGPKFIGEYKPKHDKVLKEKENQNFKNNILNLYTSKYGNPKITRRKYNNKYDDFYLSLHKIDKKDCENYGYIYTYSNQFKTIEITVDCNGKINTSIKYILTSDYINKKKMEQRKKINELENSKKEKEQTLKEI